MYAFEYHRPASVDEASKLLTGKDDPKLVAGGMTLLPTLKQRLAQPSDLVDLAAVPGLAGITVEGGTVTVGAMTTHATVQFSKAVAAAIPVLSDLAGGIGDPAVRNRGTIGGSISNNDPAADYPAAVVGLGATVTTSKRKIAGDDFFTGMFETALEPGEIVTSVSFPKPEKAAYVKFPNPASRYAVVGVLVAKSAAGVRVAVTGAAPCVFRWTEAEQALSKKFDTAALEGLTVDAGDLNADIHASAEYRAHLVGAMAKRAVAAALA